MTKKEKLIALKTKALNDNSLPLAVSATNLVFGVGNPESEIIFIGEGPGYWEDVKAEPFVGNAGKLLDKLLFSIGIDRKHVFITNVVMHRPPDNRDPSDAEIAAYQTYVDGIIDIISPRAIVTLGRFSMGKFLPGFFISDIHGKPRTVTWNKKPMIIIPMYHPAAALRNGVILERIKADFSGIPQILADFKTKKNDMMVKESQTKTDESKIKQASLF